MGVSILEGSKIGRIATAAERIAAGLARVTLTITMVGTDGNAVYDENVIVTDAATGMVLFTLPYVGTPVQVELAKDKSYIVTGTQVNLASTKFYAPNTVTGIAQSDTAVTITYQVLDAAHSLMAIQTAIAANPGVEILPVGTEVDIPWVDESATEWTVTLVLTHYMYVVKEEDKETGTLTWAAIFLHKYATIASIQFDAPEVEVATESLALSGLYYYGKVGNTYSLLALSQGDIVPYNDYDVIYHNEIKDTTFNILRYGYNRWSHCAWRQYLNSDAAVGEWWTAQHVGDVAPSQINSYRGYMAGLRVEDKNAILSIKINTALNTVSEPDKLGTLETTYDKFWLPSIKEVYGVAQLDGEGDLWVKYWRDFIGLPSVSNDANTKRRFFGLNAKTTAQVVWLRSALRGYSTNVWNVNSTGLVSSYTASSAFRGVPACAIG